MRALLLIVLLFVGAHRPAQAQVACSIGSLSMSLSGINPNSGFPYTLTGSTTYYCVNSGPSSVSGELCLAIGTGSGGLSPGNRTLALNGYHLPIAIKGQSATGSQTGDGTVYAMDGPFAITVGGYGYAAGNYSITVTIPQPSSPPLGGTYTTSFSDAYLYGITNYSGPCSNTWNAYSFNLSINATVTSTCSLTASNLAFPSASVLTVATTATSTITTTCNSATPYSIALDNGAAGSGPTARLMKSGANSITYGIYQDAAGAMPWGSTSGTNTVSASGSTTLTAYGRVPPQAAPAPGSYSDVVNVTMAY